MSCEREVFVGTVGEEDIECGEFRLKFRIDPFGDGFDAWYLGKATGNRHFYGATEEEALEKAVKAVSVDVTFKEWKRF